jgi:hypothetical protein
LPTQLFRLSVSYFFVSLMKQFYSIGGRGRAIQLAVVGLFLAAPAVHAQAPAWQSATALQSGPNNRSEINASATDASGNVYVVGDFDGTIQLGGTTLTSAGGDNTFVAKWSATTGSFVWAVRLGGTASDYGRTIAVSGTNVYVGGLFRSPSLPVGATTLLNTSQQASNSSDGFIVKLIDAGSSATFGWAQQVGGSNSEGIYGLAAVGNSVYAAGFFASPTAQVGSTVLSNAGEADVMVCKLTDAGATASVAWARRAGGAGYDMASTLAVSGSNVYVSGEFELTATFGTTALVSTSGGRGEPDMFVTKLADVGASTDFNWAVRAGGNSTFVNGLAASGSSVYAVGDFAGGTATFGSTVLSNASGFVGNDAFIAKLTDAGATGRFVWAQRAGGSDYDEANAVAVRGSSVYVTGHFASATATVGTTTLTNRTTTGEYDVFVARLTDAGATGTFDWATAAGSSDSDYSRALALSGSTVCVMGSLRTPAIFGPLTVGSAAAPNPTSVAFVATLTDATGLATTAALGAGRVELAPNPAHGRVTVQLPAGLTAGRATLTLLDALGRAVLTQTVPALPTATLDLTGLAPGIYAVRVAAGGQVATQRLAVE